MTVSWMERKTNVWVLENINPEWTLESRVAQAGLRYFRHVVREERGMENYVMLGEMSGKSRRGRPRTRWLDNMNTIKGPSIKGSFTIIDIYESVHSVRFLMTPSPKA